MASKKLTFPNRPCPKCGKPIHIKSKKHEECGWVATAEQQQSATAVAAQKPEVNKSAAVQEILSKKPNTPVKEIVSTLAAQGVKISENYVYTLKSNGKAKKQKATRPTAVAVSNRTGIANPLELIREVKQLAARAGGLRTLKELVDVLSE